MPTARPAGHTDCDPVRPGTAHPWRVWNVQSVTMTDATRMRQGVRRAHERTRATTVMSPAPRWRPAARAGAEKCARSRSERRAATAARVSKCSRMTRHHTANAQGTNTPTAATRTDFVTSPRAQPTKGSLRVSRANENAFCCIATALKLLLLTDRRSQGQQQRGLGGTVSTRRTAPMAQRSNAPSRAPIVHYKCTAVPHDITPRRLASQAPRRGSARCATIRSRAIVGRRECRARTDEPEHHEHRPEERTEKHEVSNDRDPRRMRHPNVGHTKAHRIQ